MKKTQILLTNRNSVWGVIVNPVATNTYQHITSFDTPELKDWFINKYLFGDENFDYKSVIKTKPTKPLTIISDVKVRFRVDSKDYPEFTSSEICNKDLAIILTTDTEKDLEEYSFWAINTSNKPTGNLFDFEAELDIFFTHDIKDMFIDTPIQIDRAHGKRFLDGNGLPNIFKDSINSYPEIFDDGFQFSFNNIENLFTQEIKCIYAIANKDIDSYNLVVISPKNVSYWVSSKISIGMKLEGLFEVETRTGYSAGMLFGINAPNDRDYMAMVQFNTRPEIKVPSSVSPLMLDTLHIPEGQGLTAPTCEVKASDIYDGVLDPNAPSHTLNATFLNSAKSEDFTIDNPFLYSIDMTGINDVSKNFNWQWEGKIYKQPYHNIEVVDTQTNTYQIDLVNMPISHTIQFEISVKVSLQGLHSQILFNKNYTDYESSNIIMGIYGIYDTSTDKEINEWEQYEAYHKAQFGVQKASGVIHTLFGFGGGIQSMATGNYLGGASEIANAWTGLGQTLAMQHDLQNAPRDIIAGGNIQHILNSGLFDGDLPNKFNGRDFYQINLRKPNDILLERLAWFFHIAGVNYNMTFHNVNDLLKSRYYFNYIKTSMSLFENIRDNLTFSQQVRTIIDVSMKNGLTIWHIRDKDNFKGIKYYDVNNVEMEWLQDERD